MARKINDATRAGFGATLDEGNDVANFGFDAGTVAIFFDGGAAVSGGGALELAESLGKGFVAAAKDPVDGFALAHSIEVVDGDIIAELHGFDDVGDELHAGASVVVTIIVEEGEGTEDEFFTDVEVAEGEFVDIVLVFEDDDIVDETFDLVESPGVVEKIAIGESVFETIGGKIGNIIVNEREEATVGDFASEDAIALELAHNGARIANDLAGAIFGGFLGLGIAVEEVNGMFEGGGGDIVEKGGKSLAFVVSEAPSDKGDTDAVIKDGMFVSGAVDAALIETAARGDTREALDLGGGEIFQ